MKFDDALSCNAVRILAMPPPGVGRFYVPSIACAASTDAPQIDSGSASGGSLICLIGRGAIASEVYEDVILADAPINPGNSGRALADSEGALFAINAAIVGPAGGSVGVEHIARYQPAIPGADAERISIPQKQMEVNHALIA